MQLVIEEIRAKREQTPSKRQEQRAKKKNGQKEGKLDQVPEGRALNSPDEL